jgi:uncharacterized protein (TIGR00290 family)
MSRPRVLLAWSSGKDSAWALKVLREAGEAELAGLLATVTAEHGRVSMHGVREELLEAQARAAGLALHKVRIPARCSNQDYEQAMRAACEEARAAGVTHVAFGDLLLEDVRAYREERTREAGLGALFPLWGQDTARLAREMIAGGLAARVTCLDPRALPRALAGSAFDADFLAALPPGADPCGENGEFHTFAWDGPMFRAPVPVQVGRTVEREGFLFTDLLPASEA